MTRVHVFCEGQTEEVFVREVLRPHFEYIRVYLNPIIIRTGPQSRGGVSSYGKIKWQIERKCKEDSSAWVTTMFDFYGLPEDFPSKRIAGPSIDRAKAVERAFQNDISQRNFFANLIIHEFESLLFADPVKFGAWFDDYGVVDSLSGIKNEFDTPEHINDDRNTAPSKRILAICKSYDKVIHGSLIALDIGLQTIRRECPRFDAWLKKIENLAVGNKT